MAARFVALLSGLAATLALGGCHWGTAPGADQRAALDQAETLWYASGIHNYTFDVGSHSAWFEDSLRIDVRSDTVASSTSLRNPPGHGSSVTVPQLFAAIRSSLANNSGVTASYHPTLGYPTRVNAPDPPHTADAAWSANVGNLRVH